MKHPTLILGAGASYDCFSENEKKQAAGFLNFPLANELCHAHYLGYLRDRISREEYMKRVIPPVLSKEIEEVFTGGEDFIKRIASSLNRTKSLEESVSDIWRKAAANNDKERQVQLVGFAYYLQFLFYFLSKEFGGVTTNNYYALTDHISDFLNSADTKVLVINFNYDLLMDIALGSIKDERRNRLKYAKVHGSCDKYWIARGGGFPRRMYDPGPGRELIKNYAEYFDAFFKRGPEEYDLVELGEQKQGGEVFIMRPAILLPFYSKDELGFPCFERDSQKIKSHLSNTDGILIIGWSAKDGELIKLMQDNIKEKIPLTVVASSMDEVKEIKNRLSEVPFYDDNTLDSVGFTNFLGLSPNKCEGFFSN